MEHVLGLLFSNGVGVVAVVFFVGLLIFTGKLIPVKWHEEAIERAERHAQNAKDRADRWEAVALRALDASEKLATPVEVSTKLLTQLPNPSRDEGQTP